jgi:ABC-type dipeptide/oligopeptide/nickel transport system ATPase component
VIERMETVLLLGRSGTGKTICIANKMQADRRVAPGTSQLFVARSRRICHLVASLQGSGVQAQRMLSIRTLLTYAKHPYLLTLQQRRPSARLAQHALAHAARRGTQSSEGLGFDRQCAVELQRVVCWLPAIQARHLSCCARCATPSRSADVC